MNGLPFHNSCCDHQPTPPTHHPQSKPLRESISQLALHLDKGLSNKQFMNMGTFLFQRFFSEQCSEFKYYNALNSSYSSSLVPVSARMPVTAAGGSPSFSLEQFDLVKTVGTGKFWVWQSANPRQRLNIDPCRICRQIFRGELSRPGNWSDW